MLWLRRTGLERISFPVITRDFPAMGLLVGSAAVMGIVLLLIRMVISMGFQEEVIETNLLDYMENQKGDSQKVIQIEPVRQSSNSKAARAAKGREDGQKSKGKSKGTGTASAGAAAESPERAGHAGPPGTG
ncbi:MAG: hypothetical protein ACLRMZ_05785 [Blautia marasmi]